MKINRKIKKLGTLLEALYECVNLKENYITVFEMTHANGTIIEVKSQFNNFVFLRIVYIPGYEYNPEIPDNIVRPLPLPVATSLIY